MYIFLRTVFVFFLSMIWLPSGIRAQQQMIPAAELLKQLNLPSGMGQVWEGTITFTQKDSKSKHIDNTQLGHQQEVVDRQTIQASATIRFCGCGSFYVSDVQRTWKEAWDRGRIDAYYETTCNKETADGRSEAVPVSPGNEVSEEESGSGELCPQVEENENGQEIRWFDETNYDMKPKGARVGMTPAPYHGGYWLDAAVELFVNYSSKAESLQTDVCSGKRKSSSRVMTTVPFSQEPRSSASGGEDNKTYRFQAHPVSRKFVLHKHIDFADGQEKIKGRWTLIEEKAEKPGDWNRLMVAEYTLQMKNYCNDVFNSLYEDLAMAEAYNDPTLRDRAAGDVAAYKRLVGQQAWQTYQSNGPDPIADTSIHMSASNECINDNGEKFCCVKGAKEAKKSQKERCLPDVIYKAVYAHEKKHVAQCKMDPDMFPPNNVGKLGGYETDAYIAGIHVYISWLERNCPNDNRLAVAKDRLAALKANRTR
ncbi:hypothetical protein DSCO28_47570 [Desulfosarcina ovata subsp. sediminis]|uniref:Uncharacterized protein n=1 Tax=Desulfosarcina ovata subsp. sediminis TaxID=885957 RepID=A0A5K7ZVJ2_9BACT|nr:hypothetical protein [Desulfosarcina ovata]BBO84191.1 hypothetical protein DSCO28_47570 [Desulfosarcina ovata subsp. sediminis]